MLERFIWDIECALRAALVHYGNSIGLTFVVPHKLLKQFKAFDVIGHLRETFNQSEVFLNLYAYNKVYIFVKRNFKYE